MHHTYAKPSDVTFSRRSRRKEEKKERRKEGKKRRGMGKKKEKGILVATKKKTDRSVLSMLLQTTYSEK